MARLQRRLKPECKHGARTSHAELKSWVVNTTHMHLMSRFYLRRSPPPFNCWCEPSQLTLSEARGWQEAPRWQAPASVLSRAKCCRRRCHTPAAAAVVADEGFGPAYRGTVVRRGGAGLQPHRRPQCPACMDECEHVWTMPLSRTIPFAIQAAQASVHGVY